MSDNTRPFEERFGGVLAPLISVTEISAIEKAAGHAKPYDVASDHIQTAIELFAKRPNPDYENTIKESASAVESALCIATGIAPGRVDRACGEFITKFGAHEDLMKSASSLFGFGSDAEGVRHGATTGESDVGVAEAQFVLITASTWVNYIVRTATKP